METRYPSVYLDYLGRQFRLWRQYGIADSFRTKLADLWIGYGYTQYMDAQGRYTFHSFNLLRKELGFRSVLQMIDYIKQSRSFVLLSCDVDTSLLCDRKFFQTSRPEKEFADHLTMFYSPPWHKWQKEDGKPLDGSIATSCSSDRSSNCYYNNTLDH